MQGGNGKESVCGGGRKVWVLKPLSCPRLFSLVNDHLSPLTLFTKIYKISKGQITMK